MSKPSTSSSLPKLLHLLYPYLSDYEQAPSQSPRSKAGVSLDSSPSLSTL